MIKKIILGLVVLSSVAFSWELDKRASTKKFEIFSKDGYYVLTDQHLKREDSQTTLFFKGTKQIAYDKKIIQGSKFNKRDIKRVQIRKGRYEGTRMENGQVYFVSINRHLTHMKALNTSLGNVEMEKSNRVYADFFKWYKRNYKRKR